MSHMGIKALLKEERIRHIVNYHCTQQLTQQEQTGRRKSCPDDRVMCNAL
jgi:hypothetical protein